MDEIKDCLDTLVTNPEVIEIVNKISSSYRTLTFNEKKKLFSSFNKLVSEITQSYLDLHINKHPEDDFVYSDVTLSNFYEELSINGLDKNPYIYLKDILFYHFIAINGLNYDLLTVGDIVYSSDYTCREPYVASYNNDNLKIKELVKEALEKLIVNPDNAFFKEYNTHIDNNLSESLKEEFIYANEILDNIIRADTYLPLLKISEIIDNELSSEVMTDRKKLAMYAVDNILMEVFRTEHKQLDNIEENLNTFIHEFFPEFIEYLKIQVKGSYFRIDGVSCTSNNMFLDELFKRIDHLDRLYGIIDNTISDELVEEYNKKLNKNLTKKDVYFYSKLEELDSCLKDANLEVVNYTPLTGIYSFKEDEDIYIDDNRVFNEIFKDKDFMSCVDQFLYGKKGHENLLFEIVDIMNGYYYNADFDLVLNENFDINDTMGTSSDKTIYLNWQNCNSNIDLLETLFHEYRHLMQIRELSENHHVYNKTLYKYIKMNYNDSPYEFNYSYATKGDAGYQNDIIYDLQPVEFDAENFAKYMLKGIMRESTRLKHVGNGFFNEMYSRKFKFFSNKKISLAYYENWYNLYKIDEIVSNENDSYLELISCFKRLDELPLEDVFLKDNFDSLQWCYKKEFYKALLVNKNALIQVDKEHIKINNKVFSVELIDDYNLLEQVLLNNALEHAREGKIKLVDVQKYVHEESLKFKLDKEKLNGYNLFRVYGWHRTFLKYSNMKKNKKDRVRSK